MLARTPDAERNAALRAMAASLRSHSSDILAANAADLAACTGTAAFRDRLALNEARVEAMAKGLEDIALLPDPLGRTLADWTRPNGLRIQRIAHADRRHRHDLREPAECRRRCRGHLPEIGQRGDPARRLGKRAQRGAINAALVGGLRAVGLPEACVQIAPNADRAYVAAMLAAAGLLDLIVPRGGKSLVERVQREARVPVLAHAEGLCHTYVHAAADHAMARRIVANAKMRRTGICGATETLLIDRAIAPALLPAIVADLRALGCDFRADAAARDIVPDLPPATEADFDTEWLDAILSVAVVDGVDAALAHIARHGSEHTDAIVTEDAAAAQRFLNGVDSAVALWNASTQFCDGGEFGFGAEIGIATGRIHARGPVGPEQLTTYRYLVIGNGQVRP